MFFIAINTVDHCKTFKAYSGLLYLSLFYSCTVILDIPYSHGSYQPLSFVIHSKDELAKMECARYVKMPWIYMMQSRSVRPAIPSHAIRQNAKCKLKHVRGSWIARDCMVPFLKEINIVKLYN